VESRISYATGFNLAASNNPGPGSFFGLTSAVPALLRGNPAGMSVSVLVRVDGTENDVNPTPPAFELVAGDRDFAVAESGWAVAIITGGDQRAMSGGIGSIANGTRTANGLDTVLTYTWDGSEHRTWVNGVLQDHAGGGTLVAGPDNFGIGGTADPSWPALDPGTGGLWRSSVGGLWVTPDVLDAAAVHDHYRQVQLANDMRAVGVGGNPPSAAAYLWSVRRGLPQLVDGGTETWVDEIQGLALARIGVTTGASVRGRDVDWDQTQTSTIVV